jgi:hypothetical protein
MATDMVDLASVGLGADSGSASTGSEVSTPEITPTTETPNTGSEHAPVESSEHAEGAETDPDGTPKAKTDGLEVTKSPNLASIRTTLKGLRDAANPETPEGKATLAAVKELHGSLERWAASKAIFPGGIAEQQKTQSFLRELSGDPKGGLQAAQDAWVKNQEILTSIHESDQLLYEGDGRLIENIVADLKSEGKIDALGKMAPAFLAALKANDSDGYYKAFAAPFVEGMREAGVPAAVNGIWKALQSGNTEEAKSLVKGLGQWFTDLSVRTEQAKVDPLTAEREAIAKEKADFETSKKTEVGQGIARSAEKENNTILATDLKTYLKMPFFKGFSRENLTPLANSIKADLYATLKADTAYQAHMKGLWLKPKENAEKIAEYHKSKVQSISATVVRNAVQRMYPGYSKNGTAAGRAANAAATKAADAAANAKAIATGKPIYVAQKPSWESLDMEHKDKNGKPDAQLLYIGGKGFMKDTGRFVTWRR